MRFSRLIVSVFLLGFVVLGSCSKDSSTGATTFTSGIIATIDGSAWDGSSTATAVKTGNTLNMQSTINGQTLQIVVNENLAVGTFPLGGFNSTMAQIMELSGPKVWLTTPDGTGLLTITKLTSTDIEGTFYFDAVAFTGGLATGTKKVTDGKFALKLM